MLQPNTINTSGEMPSKEEIRDRLRLENSNPQKFVITPLINPNKQIEDGTVDLRLGNDFVLAKRSKLGELNALEESEDAQIKIMEYQERTYVRLGKGLILHPHQFALGSTFEYIKMPADFIALARHQLNRYHI